MTRAEVLKEFEPTGGGKLPPKQSICYLRMEKSFQSCASDMLEYVDDCELTSEAFDFLMESKKSCLMAITGEMPEPKKIVEEKKGFFGGKKR